MKYLLICLIFSISLFSQFSSNVDYKELSRKKNSFGFSFSNSMAENEWKTNFINAADTVEFTGNYDLLKNDFSLNGYYYFTEDRLSYSVDISKANYTSIATIDTTGSRERIDLGESSLSNLGGSIGFISGDDKYGGSIIFQLLSFVDANRESSKCAVSSISGFFNKNTSSGNKYGFELAYSIFFGNTLIDSARSYDVISPKLDLGFHYSFIEDAYSIKLYSDINIYDSKVYKDNSYIHLALQCKGALQNVKSFILADIGTYVSTKFKIPEIQLPYLFYSISLENKLFSEKVRLKVGWRSELFKAVIGNYDDLAEVIPMKYPEIFDLEETMTKNKLFIELDYSY